METNNIFDGAYSRIIEDEAWQRVSGDYPFSADFMFQLDKEDVEILKSQNVTSSWGGDRRLPYAFTEQGIAMLSSVLKSQTAVEVNIRRLANARIVLFFFEIHIPQYSE